MSLTADQLVTLKAELAKATAAAEAAKAAMEARAAELTETQKATDKKLVELAAQFEALNKQGDEIIQRLQAPDSGLPGADAEDKKGQELARRAHLKVVRGMALGNGREMEQLSAEERELVMPHVSSAPGKRALSVSNDVLGGFLVMPAFTNRMIEKLVQISQLRQLATVMSIGTTELKMVAEAGVLTAQWVHERGTRAETTGNMWDLLTIPTHELYALVKPTHQLLEDSEFPLEAWLEGRVARQFARSEGAAFLTGNGAGRPRGLMAHPNVEVLDADASAGLAAGQFTDNDLVDLMADLESEYAQNGTVLAHRKTVAFIRKMKDNQNRLLDIVKREVLAGLPGLTIDGYRGAEMPDMAQVGTASALVLAFGDIREAYTIVDRNLMVLLRDPFTSKLDGVVDLMYRKRVGGDVVNPAAVKILRATA